MKLHLLVNVLIYLLYSNSLFSMDDVKILKDEQPKKTITSLKKLCLDTLTSLKMSKKINVTSLTFCQKEQIFGVISTLYFDKDEELYNALSLFNVCDVKTKIRHFEQIRDQIPTIQKPMISLYS